MESTGSLKCKYTEILGWHFLILLKINEGRGKLIGCFAILWLCSLHWHLQLLKYRVCHSSTNTHQPPSTCRSGTTISFAALGPHMVEMECVGLFVIYVCMCVRGLQEGLAGSALGGCSSDPEFSNHHRESNPGSVSSLPQLQPFHTR